MAKARMEGLGMVPKLYASDQPIRIGVSSFLLGAKVRFDGGHDYRRGLVPLIAPIALFRHYVRKFDIAYLGGQVYLVPHPKEFMLRNHV
jgi:hypothetical protein